MYRSIFRGNLLTHFMATISRAALMLPSDQQGMRWDPSAKVVKWMFKVVFRYFKVAVKRMKHGDKGSQPVSIISMLNEQLWGCD